MTQVVCFLVCIREFEQSEFSIGGVPLEMDGRDSGFWVTISVKVRKNSRISWSTSPGLLATLSVSMTLSVIRDKQSALVF